MGYIIYDRCNVAVLGTDVEAENSECIESQGNRCFNCGSPQHIVTKCTEPLNRPLIALSRAMYEFFKDPGKGEPERLHEYEERKAKRLRFNESFKAGSICGELLREALGMNLADSNEGEQRDLPWLWRMLEWGYPPGWVSEGDPKAKILARIEGESIWTDDLDATAIFDTSPQNSTIGHMSDSTKSSATHSGTSITPTVTQFTIPKKRWAHYPTTLFSSEHLAVYSGMPLPPLIHSDSSPVAARKGQGNAVPPWRRPGAFSAFGPAGWQEYVRGDDISMQGHRLGTRNDCNEETVEESDMDLSE